GVDNGRVWDPEFHPSRKARVARSVFLQNSLTHFHTLSRKSAYSEISAAALRRGHAHPSRSRAPERPASPSPSPSPSPLASPPLNKKVPASPHGGGIYHPLPDPY
ncbi:hypothetical protein Goklo_002281, partial [Gossypium klotzschianum]|nr:hypothetical protein [Gossypium klotzschianum]